jgi:hypothetical protein
LDERQYTMTIADDLVVMFSVIPWTQVSAVLALFSSYLFSILYSFLPRHAPTKHTFSVLASLSLFSALFGLRDFPQLMISPMLIYGLAFVCRGSRVYPIVSFVICITHLCVHYVSSQLMDESTVSFDSTAPLMVMVIKLTSFAWCLHDGTKDHEVCADLLMVRNCPSIRRSWPSRIFHRCLNTLDLSFSLLGSWSGLLLNTESTSALPSSRYLLLEYITLVASV